MTDMSGSGRCAGNKSILGRIFCDRRGVAAVEFALIFPLMITFYFGAVESTNMLTANRRVTSVAYTAADITAQAISVSNSDMTDIFAASSAILRPFSITPLSIRISSVVANSSGVNKVAWSDGYQIAGRSVNSTMTLPAGLTTAGTSVIVAEVVYEYSSPISETVTDTVTFSDTAYLKPRRASQVSRTN
ncbi:TadE/TadG family type IV pilus assembly protein [Parvibaculum sp.]|uniref:TadE/TadG family type IV pilus assembly protein n=1 Tax=Parvibaculum sp. TaxID=2024848 RepID=UPI003297DBBB